MGMMTGLSMIIALIASAGFVYGIHIYLRRNKSYEVEFVDFFHDYAGAEYALFVDVDDADRTIAIPMNAIERVMKKKNGDIEE